MLAQVGGAAALIFAVASIVVNPSLVSLGPLIVGLAIGWRLLQLGVGITEDQVVVNNLFQSSRVPLASAVVSRRKTDLRTRQGWGGHIPVPIPKLADDNMRTHARIVYVNDAADPSKSIHVDASWGRVPANFDYVFDSMTSVVEAHRSGTRR